MKLVSTILRLPRIRGCVDVPGRRRTDSRDQEVDRLVAGLGEVRPARRLGVEAPGRKRFQLRLVEALAVAQVPGPRDDGRGAVVRTEMRARLDASPILGGVVAAVSGVMIVILNFVIDNLYAYVDPRIRLQR